MHSRGNVMQEIIDLLVAYGLFSLIVSVGAIALFLRSMRQFDKEKQVQQPTVQVPLYERQAEEIILQLL